MRIDTSIQDFLRKINSRILFYIHPAEALFFSALALFFLIFIITLSFITKEDRHVFIYTEGKEEEASAQGKGSASFGYFGAKSGKVYYTSFCKAGSRVKEVNRVYFAKKEEAIGSGRTLSKLCE
jgi:hypothetical protein